MIRGYEPFLCYLRELLGGCDTSAGGGGASVEVVRRVGDENGLLLDELDAVPVRVRVGEDAARSEVRGGGVVGVEAHPGTFPVLADQSVEHGGHLLQAWVRPGVGGDAVADVVVGDRVAQQVIAGLGLAAELEPLPVGTDRRLGVVL